MEANRYDYVSINSKRIDTPITAHRDLMIKATNGNLSKTAADNKYYTGTFKFMVLGEKRSLA